MTEPTAADRAKAAEIAQSLTYPTLLTFGGQVDAIAAALAAERAATVADLRARVLALAEEAEQAWGLLRGAYVADRLRAAVTDTTGGKQ